MLAAAKLGRPIVMAAWVAVDSYIFSAVDGIQAIEQRLMGVCVSMCARRLCHCLEMG